MYVPPFSGENVLLHCRAGAHRAGSMAAILVCKLEKLSLDRAIQHVKRGRPIIDVSGWNLRALQDFLLSELWHDDAAKLILKRF